MRMQEDLQHLHLGIFYIGQVQVCRQFQKAYYLLTLLPVFRDQKFPTHLVIRVK